MARSSARSGQTEPLAALAAVFVVGLALSAYAGAFDAVEFGDRDRSPADPTVERIERNLTSGGVVTNADLDAARALGPDGYHVTVTLSTDAGQTSAGPTPPETADRARRRVSVAKSAGGVDTGLLEVAVWQ